MVTAMSSPPPVSVVRPEQPSLPVVLSCPHAGTFLPEELRQASALDDDILLQATDFGVLDLIEPAAAALSVPLVIATAILADLVLQTK